MAWAWYGAVAVLSLLLVTDREAAWVFVFLGHYPIIKPWLDRRRMKYLWKALLFNGLVALLYWLLIRLGPGMGDNEPVPHGVAADIGKCEFFPLG